VLGARAGTHEAAEQALQRGHPGHETPDARLAQRPRRPEHAGDDALLHECLQPLRQPAPAPHAAQAVRRRPLRAHVQSARRIRGVISALVSALHLFALALGLPAVFLRGRALEGRLDAEGLRRLFAADNV
jgi:hypothetical protein